MILKNATKSKIFFIFHLTLFKESTMWVVQISYEIKNKTDLGPSLFAYFSYSFNNIAIKKILEYIFLMS